MTSYGLVHDSQVVTTHTQVQLIQNENYANRFKAIAKGTYGDLVVLAETLNKQVEKIKELEEYKRSTDIALSTFTGLAHEHNITKSEYEITQRRAEDLEQRLSDLVSAVDGNADVLDRYDQIRANRAAEKEGSADE